MYSSAIEQPSTTADSSIIDDTIVHDSLVKDVNLPETEEVEKEIDAEVEQPLEAGPSEDLEESSTVHTSDNGNKLMIDYKPFSIEDLIQSEVRSVTKAASEPSSLSIARPLVPIAGEHTEDSAIPQNLNTTKQLKQEAAKNKITQRNKNYQSKKKLSYFKKNCSFALINRKISLIGNSQLGKDKEETKIEPNKKQVALSLQSIQSSTTTNNNENKTSETPALPPLVKISENPIAQPQHNYNEGYR
ncbi:unnamed protein product [Psylliodes chrysocephalus]|uniref:Uncharacterized protein n=1 Tax=Psylliodes chrysocephalus TaxID=3402493 RepID=A0A9P0GJD3_9CUCU|nr:unnamed protein product [Psylliodes chrysocephala]